MQVNDQDVSERKMLFFDTESHFNIKEHYDLNSNNVNNKYSLMPNIYQIAWQIYLEKNILLITKKYQILKNFNYMLIKTNGNSEFSNPFTKYFSLSSVIQDFISDMEICDIIVGHNINYDINNLIRVLWWMDNLKLNINGNRSAIPVSRSGHKGFSPECSFYGGKYRPLILLHS
jgi:hypothetical protein